MSLPCEHQTPGALPKPPAILVVDDEPDNLDAFQFNFRKDFRLLLAQSAQEALALLQTEQVAVIVTDQRMPQMTGLAFLREAKSKAPLAVPIIVTAYTDVEVLIEAIHLSDLYRYVKKPWDQKELRGVLFQALERHKLLTENARLTEQLRQYAGYLEKELRAQADFGKLVGDSPAWRAALARVEQVARTHATVLLRGESGTGKELLAHALHVNSPRKDRPFVRVHCAALPLGVLESELFGHERGAFTGASGRHIGRFELAHRGTIFLDEVGDLPLDMQVKLLRVLQERTFERVGGSETISVDVRVISATHRDLEAMIAQGTFRRDLYYRLNVFPIDLPPLRERVSDVPALCEHFLRKWSKHAAQPVLRVSPAALERLSHYPFPGNVRELENLIERALILATGPEITPAELELLGQDTARPLAPEPGKPRTAQQSPKAAPLPKEGTPHPTEATLHPHPRTGFTPPLAGTHPLGDDAASGGERTLSEKLLEQERAEILSAIERSDGNIAHAARLLGCNRSTLYYRLRKLDLLHLLPNPRPEHAPEPAFAEGVCKRTVPLA